MLELGILWSMSSRYSINMAYLLLFGLLEWFLSKTAFPFCHDSDRDGKATLKKACRWSPTWVKECVSDLSSECLSFCCNIDGKALKSFIQFTIHNIICVAILAAWQNNCNGGWSNNGIIEQQRGIIVGAMRPEIPPLTFFRSHFNILERAPVSAKNPISSLTTANFGRPLQWLHCQYRR